MNIYFCHSIRLKLNASDVQLPGLSVPGQVVAFFLQN